ncbi:hypothetical protein [Emcibacter nanhaiensis]|uniref:Uncharacterized protein n=1 Tax=Emcibacter nanhaiensis TaxID=1505037 RepID=A0A501PH51_9PROT|nr:hypothetical protein [Emcibacter nanhaiensis]TPD59407.1 hypothetical protein FIV46_11475 [Emcibacter nanhaiensis]
MTIFTDSIDRNSFIGLVTNGVKVAKPRRFKKVEGASMLASFAILSALVIGTIAAGTVTQQKVETARYAAAVAQQHNV